MSLDSFPRYPLLFGPSPVHPLDRLSDHLGGARVWAKREDCNSGLAFGGNKTRKLEYLVPDALAAGADTLVTIGGVQSNHTRQVAAVAARAGLKAVLVQESWVDWPDAVNDKVGNILLSRVMGADVRLVEAGFGIDASAKAAETRAQVEKIARATAELIGLGRDLREDEITVLEGWAGDLYGVPVQSTVDAIRLTGRLEGVILDPVYEGKSMAGLIDLVRDGRIPRDSTVLYAHLGGQPALNAYSGVFR
ncbi:MULTISPECIES: pyridoxal-phosphate dependent enzyme [unclassified Nonomuraea]|uniref:pyridoxal-phosphate dependent enzyme n=1 Tax=unclassified Nonomuraea TaxID=2593643 RepID=UPI003401D5E8